MDLYQKGYLNDVTVDFDNQRALTRFLDAGTIARRIFMIIQLRKLFSGD